MAKVNTLYSECRRILCRTAKRRKTITYGDLAAALGLPSPRRRWSTVLNPICEEEKRKTGSDLTLVVVYKTGPAKGLGRYFSNTGRPQSTLLDPFDRKQVTAYKQERERVFDTYNRSTC